MCLSCSRLKAPMSSDGLKVALLARAGIARDRLREAVESAGAECVMEADPLEVEPAALAASAARVVLVALDHQSEDALERFDEVLADPGREVIFEEASLAASRDGWDLARWQRHLVAKIQRNGNVLPPGTEEEASGTAGDGSDSGPAGEVNPFDPVFAETSCEPAVGVAAFEPGDVADGLDLTLAIEPAAADQAHTDNVPTHESNADEAEPAATGGFGVLSLDDGDAPSASPTATEYGEAKDRFARDISDLEQRISGLSLVDDSPRKDPEGARGAVLVFSGLGGPDAVRQLVAALPAEFPRPVLIQQRLDGGRHDKLVAQMQRATELPVRLAEPHQVAHAGIIYILSAELGVEVSESGIRFQPGAELLTALPAADSAVLLLSGCDPLLVDATLKQGWAGALVAGQTAEGCYDAAASSELASRGGDTGTLVELAKRLADRWPA